MPEEIPEQIPDDVQLTQDLVGMRTVKITLPPNNTFPLTAEDIFKLIQILFDKVITGTENNIDIRIESDAFNVTITVTLRN